MPSRGSAMHAYTKQGLLCFRARVSVCRLWTTCLCLLAAVAGMTKASAQAPPAVCSKAAISQESGGKYMLKANASTVHWGYFCEWIDAAASLCVAGS